MPRRVLGTWVRGAIGPLRRLGCVAVRVGVLTGVDDAGDGDDADDAMFGCRSWRGVTAPCARSHQLRASWRFGGTVPHVGRRAGGLRCGVSPVEASAGAANGTNARSSSAILDAAACIRWCACVASETTSAAAEVTSIAARACWTCSAMCDAASAALYAVSYCAWTGANASSSAWCICLDVDGTVVPCLVRRRHSCACLREQLRMHVVRIRH